MTAQGEMSDEDIRLAQIRKVRELIAGRAEDDTVRIADVHEALDNPIGEFMVDMVTPGPKEVLAEVRRTVQQKVDGELTTFQALVKIRDLCESFDWTEGKERRCGYVKRHPSHTFMRLEVLFQCPGKHGTEGER